MNLPFLKKHNPEKEFFLSLIFKPHKVRVILFENINKNLTIIASSEVESEKHIEELSVEDLITLSDKVVSSIDGKTSGKETISKTIFAVPFSWVEEGRIKKDHLVTLKKICEALALTPIGFIISVEAIIGYLQKKQGAPLTSIFVELTPGEELSLYIVKLGNIVESFKGKRGEDIVVSVEDLLKQVKAVDVLPSQIVIFNYPNEAEIEQKFLSHSWTTSLPFLHLPQVTVLEKGFEDEALIRGVASQMGVDVLEGGSATVSDITTSDSSASVEEDIAVVPEEFGFVEGKDIAKVEDSEPEEKQEVVEPVPDGEPVIKYAQPPKDENEEKNQASDESIENVVPVATHHMIHQPTKEESDEKDESRDDENKNSLMNFAALSSSLTPILHKIVKMPHTILKKLPVGKTIMLLPLGVVLLLLAGVIYLYYTAIEKAEIAITLDKKTFSKSQAVTFSTKGSSSFSNNVLSLKALDQDISSDKTIDTTGKKDTGDKAKGEVTLYNKTEQKRTFSKGTVLTGPNSLEFVTLDDVSIATTSAFATSLSSAKVKVEASKFGQEYNIPSSSNFTIKDVSASSYFGKNDSAFSGGTKKSLQVVSKKDIDSLTSSITDSVKDQAVKDATATLGSDEGIFNTPLSVAFKDKTFTKKEGDEAKQVGLTAKITYTMGVYKKTELNDYAKELSKSEIPGDYNLEEKDSQIDVKDIKLGKNQEVSATLDISQIYIPTVDIKKIAEDATGKDVNNAEKIIRSFPGVTSVTVTFKRKVPFLPSFLPFNKNNIEVTVGS